MVIAILRMVHHIRENLRMDLSKVKVHIIMLLGRLIREIGIKEKKMELVSLVLLMEINLEENLKRIEQMVKGVMFIEMEFS